MLLKSINCLIRRVFCEFSDPWKHPSLHPNGQNKAIRVFREVPSPCTIPRKDVSLTGTRGHLRIDRRSRPSALRVATLVCLVLLAFLAVIQVTHVHASDSDADHCTLCIVMHSIVPLVIMLVTVVLVRLRTPAPVLLEVPSIVRYWHPTLFTRPPPAGC